jgi:hypothetical protein
MGVCQLVVHRSCRDRGTRTNFRGPTAVQRKDKIKSRNQGKRVIRSTVTIMEGVTDVLAKYIMSSHCSRSYHKVELPLAQIRSFFLKNSISVA